MGLAQARKTAQAWAQKAQEKFDLECTYEQGDTQDTLCFARPGIKGTLDVLGDALDFHAQLGFLFSAFKERIEGELHQQLDDLLGTTEPSAGGAHLRASLDQANEPDALQLSSKPIARGKAG